LYNKNIVITHYKDQSTCLSPRFSGNTKRHNVTKCSVYYRFSYQWRANSYQNRKGNLYW